MSKNLNDPRKTQAIALKVAIQINCKIGGAPWTVANPLKVRNLTLKQFSPGVKMF